MNVNKLSLVRHEEVEVFKKWCFPHYSEERPWSIENIPMNMVVLFNSIGLLSKLLPFKSDYFYKELSDLVYIIDRPLQLVAFLGRTKLLEHILEVTPIFVILNTF